MQIAGREIDIHHSPYIISEISGNHCGILANAIRLIKAAKRAGADAVKTQCYTPDSMTLDLRKTDFIVQSGLWRGKTLYELYESAHTPPEWHKELYHVAQNEGITIFSSVFDRRSVDLLDALGCPAYKIASFEIVDTPLIEYASNTGKPLIISTGLASMREIVDADDASDHKAAFLHCTSEYPAIPEHASLHHISLLKEMFKFERLIGLSDHTQGWEVPVAATALGAVIIEKHLKLENSNGSKPEDDSFSMVPTAFGDMVKMTKGIWLGLRGSDHSSPARQFRRSLYAVEDIKEGEIYTTENIRSIRPGYGLPPKMLPNLLGKKARRDWRKGDPLS